MARKVPLCLLLLPIALAAQTPAPARRAAAPPRAPVAEEPVKDPAAMEGRVVHIASGAPIRKATVTLRASDRGASSSTISDAEGHFAFTGIAPGSYRLVADRTGFLRQEYGAKRPRGGGGTPIVLGAGEHMKDVVFKLSPQSVITGTVLDEDGDPVDHAQVSVIVRRTFPGAPKLSTIQGQNTNDIGEFRIAQLPPGRYYLSASSGRRGMPGGDNRLRAKAPPEDEYVPTYYPGVTDLASSTPVEITTGQDVGGIQIKLRKSRVYRISGKLQGLAGGQRNVRVTLMPRDRTGLSGGPGGGGAGVKQDGSFEFAGVQPGSYYVLGRKMEGRTQMLARVAVDVGASNVDNVLLDVVEGVVSVTGTVSLEGQDGSTLNGMNISLSPLEAGASGSANTRVTENGSFKLEGAARDRYTVGFGGLPEGAYVKSMRVGGQEMIEKALDLSSVSSVALEIALAANGGALEGAVVSDKQPAPGSFIALIPDPVRPEAQFRVKSASADQNGRFSIKGIAPGRYTAYALDDPQPLSLRDPESWKQLDGKGVTVIVKEGAAEQVELTLLNIDEPRP